MIKVIVQYYRATSNSISSLRIFYVKYGQHQYKPGLKDRLIRIFVNKILFLTPENNMNQVILQRNSLIEQPVWLPLTFEKLDHE